MFFFIIFYFIVYIWSSLKGHFAIHTNSVNQQLYRSYKTEFQIRIQVDPDTAQSFGSERRVKNPSNN